MSKNKYFFIFKVPVIALFFIFSAGLLFAQSTPKAPMAIKPDREYQDFQIKESEENLFVFELEKGQHYSIVVEQKGIDLILRLSDVSGNLIKEQDSPNGTMGPEKIFLEPENKNRFFLSVKPVEESGNKPAGQYSIRVSRLSGELPTFRLESLEQDFDLLVNSLREAHTGLNWYSTLREFDDFCTNQRKLLRDKMTVLEFYRVIAPIIGFTKEGHTSIRLSADDANYFQAFGRYFPFQIKFLNRRAYVINDFDGIKAKGFLLTKINGKSIDEIVKTFLSIEPDDGYIMTGKYRWIEENGNFSKYYLRCFGDSANFAVELTDPQTNRQIVLDNVRALGYKEYQRLWKESVPPREIEYPPAKIEFQSETATAVLTFNSFNPPDYKDAKIDFKEFVAGAFEQIRNREVKNLIIDLRKNGGGAEGYEDYVFAFMTDQSYTKYRYVQGSAFQYSFLKYTNYNTKNKQDRLESALKAELYLSSDGRLLRKNGFLPPAEPRKDAYQGKIYVLTSGLTYSGGSEFASLIKGHRAATFIGEETGGGYYGNTSGIRLNLTLPQSQIIVRIPILKFVVEVAGEIPFGHGVIPDYEVQPTIEEYLNGVDAEINYAFKLIQANK